ncbi:MAG: hypothetical protein ACOC29_00040 [Candidatus Sumerlaeota bacterium]
MQAEKLKPEIKSEWMRLVGKPDLNHLPLLNEDYPDATDDKRNQPNDHCIFRGPDGAWHLWACVRHTRVGRLLCHWESPELTRPDWDFVETIRADRDAGESLLDWHGQEFLQSPFVVEENGTWYMFYGGYCTGFDSAGCPDQEFESAENQVCLMTSTDARNWTRHRNPEGFSRVFVGPGGTRDEYLIKIDDTWHMYYTGHHDGDTENESIYLRTSRNLLDWSDWKMVHYDRVHGIQQTESPIVVRRGNAWYLLRSGAKNGGQLVVRSEDPNDFQSAKDPSMVCAQLPGIIAPEIIIGEDGAEYISNILSPRGRFEGIWLAELQWIES